MPVQSKLEKVTDARNVIAGIKKRLLGDRNVILEGDRYTPRQVLRMYEAQLAAIARVSTAWAAYQEALRAEKALRVPMRRTTVSLKRYVQIWHGPAGCADFRWEMPKKTGPKTVAGKLAGVQKRAKKRQAT